MVQPNKKYSKTVSTPFHVSQAVLDTNSISGDQDVQLILKSDKVDYILCILKKSGTVQVPLDLIFSEGDEISFRSVGKCFDLYIQRIIYGLTDNNRKKFNSIFYSRRHRTFDWIFG